MHRLRTLALLVVAMSAIGLASCSSSSSSSTTTTSTTAAPSTTTTVANGGAGTTAPSSTTSSIPPVSEPSPAGTFGTKPTVVVPTGAPPTVLQSSDLIVGKGAKTVTASDTVTVQYVGVAWSTGKQFDASWDDGNGQPVSFPLDEVIPGWTQGMVGMKVGGRRELVIPPSLAYGAQGKAPIGPNETLIFIVDLYKIS